MPASRSRSTKRLAVGVRTKAKARTILKATTQGPAAYVLPANDPRHGTQAELLRMLQKQRV